ncbi:uncharacterized protein LOC112467101 isoform X2 [Temnothorax curvispinosus]|uniref:Uncharacterized protein LOC112467101 isoform X1 n=1 Tax=Temnothorax curvispinosus TaxID=300111 RepID=A0A6J1RER6_9HYME|nr:uncharacterized protein LOC112467101 isoform X1 [Temnothorax curvispinosus]XP_024891337.1 uncharacterized protein LOC112467101 isoform X2 [Temnothorax curvispinosus]
MGAMSAIHGPAHLPAVIPDCRQSRSTELTEMEQLSSMLTACGGDCAGVTRPTKAKTTSVFARHLGSCFKTFKHLGGLQIRCLLLSSYSYYSGSKTLELASS